MLLLDDHPRQGARDGVGEREQQHCSVHTNTLQSTFTFYTEYFSQSYCDSTEVYIHKRKKDFTSFTRGNNIFGGEAVAVKPFVNTFPLNHHVTLNQTVEKNHAGVCRVGVAEWPIFTAMRSREQ